MAENIGTINPIYLKRIYHTALLDYRLNAFKFKITLSNIDTKGNAK
jgi:hypothetical protein